MTMTERFNHNATTVNEAKEYLLARAEQLLIDDIKFVKFANTHNVFTGAVTALFEDNKTKEVYASHYILNQARNTGLYPVIAKSVNKPIITLDDCDIIDYLSYKNIPYRVGGSFIYMNEYLAIQKFYGNTKAKRSGIPYMNHVDEGIAILRYIGSNVRACQAFCLHPMVQIDEDFKNNYEQLTFVCKSPWVMAIAVEYRNVANAYLSPMGRRNPEDIKLSPIKDVNDMLIADKVQNRKDFEQHKDKYVNAKELDYYFRAWLERLEISEDTYEELRDRITIKY
jgi:hypothetical protein